MTPWNNDILDFVRRMRNETDLTWDQISEIVETDYDIQITGNALRKALARRSEMLPIPDPVTNNVAPLLEIPYTNCLVLFDLHAGYHHTAFITQMVRLARIAGIETVITDGDIFDFSSISRFPNTSKEPSINDDLENAGKLLEWLGNYFKTYMIDANHSARLKKKLNQYVDLQRICAMALNGRTASVTATNREYMVMGDFLFAHPSEMHSSVVGKVPLQLVHKFNKNVLTGHTHKAGHVFAENGKIGLEVGCCVNSDLVPYKHETVNAYGDFVLGSALIIEGEIFHFDKHGNTNLNGNIRKPFSFWEKYFNK